MITIVDDAEAMVCCVFLYSGKRISSNERISCRFESIRIFFTKAAGFVRRSAISKNRAAKHSTQRD